MRLSGLLVATVLLLFGLFCVGVAYVVNQNRAAPAVEEIRFERIVSMVPSVTEVLFALDLW